MTYIAALILHIAHTILIKVTISLDGWKKEACEEELADSFEELQLRVARASEVTCMSLLEQEGDQGYDHIVAASLPWVASCQLVLTACVLVLGLASLSHLWEAFRMELVCVLGVASPSHLWEVFQTEMVFVLVVASFPWVACVLEVASPPEAYAPAVASRTEGNQQLRGR